MSDHAFDRAYARGLERSPEEEGLPPALASPPSACGRRPAPQGSTAISWNAEVHRGFLSSAILERLDWDTRVERSSFSIRLPGLDEHPLWSVERDARAP